MEVILGFGVFLAALLSLALLIALRKLLFVIGWVVACLATLGLLGSLVMGDMAQAELASLFCVGGIGLMLPMLCDDIP